MPGLKKIAFVGGLLIDGTGNLPIKNSLLLIDGKKIVYAGEMRSDFGSEYEKVDISGKTIMPGLIDSHLHFTGNLTDDDSDWVLEDNIQKTIVAVAQANETLNHGITSVGEISRSGIHIRNMINDGIIPGPRMIATGLGFCRTGGHGDSHKLPANLNYAAHPWAEVADGKEQLRKGIRTRSRDTADAVKIWSTGGGIWEHDVKEDLHYTKKEIETVTEEARMVGLPVWSHAEGYEGALLSCEAGVYLIIHGPKLNDKCLDIMKEKGIFFCPTRKFYDGWFSIHPPKDERIKKNSPKEVIDAVVKAELDRIDGNLRKAHEKGIKIVAGSDSFCSSLTPYGSYLIEEIYALKKAGLSEMDAILAATRNGAEMLKLSDVTGTLEKDKFADLIVLNKNPLENIYDLSTENMEIIMKDGVFVRRNYELMLRLAQEMKPIEKHTKPIMFSNSISSTAKQSLSTATVPANETEDDLKTKQVASLSSLN